MFGDLAQTAEPASLLRHRLIVPRQPVQGVETAADGLAVVLDTLGRVDIDEIARLLGVDRASAIAELDDQVFQVPGSDDEWQTSAHYLSRNVREKLDAAKAAEAAEPGLWSRHVTRPHSRSCRSRSAPVTSPPVGCGVDPRHRPRAVHRDILNVRRGELSVAQLSGS